MHRRQFLKLLAALSTAPLINRRQSDDVDSIIIVGAGAAGLAAAYWLREAGYTPIILEARDRIGGRIFTNYDLAAFPVEFGAEFVEGENVITWELIEEFDLPTLLEEDVTAYAYQGGKFIDREEDSELNDFLAQFEGQAQAWADEDDDDVSIRDLLEMWAKENDITLTDELIALVNSEFAPDEAADIDQLGLYGYMSETYEDDGEETYKITKGYTALLNLMAEGLNIRLSTPIQRIAWNAEGASLFTPQGTYTARKVIITLPLGVLQSGDVVFEPALPAAKQDAIDQIGAGDIAKIILKFNEAFWDEEMSYWQTPLPTQFWWRPGIGFDDETPVLIALVGGSSVQRFVQMSEAEVIAAAVSDLATMFNRPDLANLLVEGHFMAWTQEPYTQMGYSYLPVDVDEDIREVLGAPVEDVLFFAGEATNPLRPACVHGAMESGVRAADELMETL